MDDLIVIILTLILIVAGSLGQLKKRAAEKNKVNDYVPDDSDDLWSLPGDNEVTDDKPVTNYYKKHQSFPEEADRSYQFKDGYTSDKRIYQAVRKSQDNSLNKVKKRKFPLRKAVIYNEILNRKYT
jgi:hypothetical protein